MANLIYRFRIKQVQDVTEGLGLEQGTNDCDHFSGLRSIGHGGTSTSLIITGSQPAVASSNSLLLNAEALNILLVYRQVTWTNARK